MKQYRIGKLDDADKVIKPVRPTPSIERAPNSSPEASPSNYK